MSEDRDSRLEALELKIMEFELAQNELDAVVIRQGAEIRQLTETLEAALARLDSGCSEFRESGSLRRPPAVASGACSAVIISCVRLWMSTGRLSHNRRRVSPGIMVLTSTFKAGTRGRSSSPEKKKANKTNTTAQTATLNIAFANTRKRRRRT